MAHAQGSRTVPIYGGLVRSHIEPYFENVTVAEVTLARVRRWRNAGRRLRWSATT